MDTNKDKETIKELIKALKDLCWAYRLIPGGTEHYAYKQAFALLVKLGVK